VGARTVSLFWRIFAVNAGLLALIAFLLIFTPVTIQAPPTLTEVLIIVIGLGVTVAANALLLRRALAPLERLAQRMDTLDLLRPGQRLQAVREDEVGRVVHAFNAMLERLEGERQRSGRRVLAAQEAERVGIARDLHDAVGQLLTGVLLELNSIAEAAPEHRREIDLERDFDPSLPQLDPETELAVYRIAQESLTNIARHSNASRVTIALERDPDSIVLLVRDDGRGFDGAMPEEHGGLRSMRERALLVDGALAIKESPRGGVEVRLEVPITPVGEPVGAKS
jgi:two-component system sensor histidine kinase UhpB